MAYTHSYIPYNCDILLIHKVHALTYSFPHKSSHSLQTISYTQNMDVFGPIHTNLGLFLTIPKQSSGLSVGSPLTNIESTLWNPIPRPFPASCTPKHNLMHKSQHKQPKQSIHCHRLSKTAPNISNNSVPSFGTDQTATHGLNQLNHQQNT